MENINNKTPESIILNDLKLRFRLLLLCRKYGFKYTMENFNSFYNVSDLEDIYINYNNIGSIKQDIYIHLGHLLHTYFDNCVLRETKDEVEYENTLSIINIMLDSIDRVFEDSGAKFINLTKSECEDIVIYDLLMNPYPGIIKSDFLELKNGYSLTYQKLSDIPENLTNFLIIIRFFLDTILGGEEYKGKPLFELYEETIMF